MSSVERESCLKHDLKEFLDELDKLQSDQKEKPIIEPTFHRVSPTYFYKREDLPKNGLCGWEGLGSKPWNHLLVPENPDKHMYMQISVQLPETSKWSRCSLSKMKQETYKQLEHHQTKSPNDSYFPDLFALVPYHYTEPNGDLHEYLSEAYRDNFQTAQKIMEITLEEFMNKAKIQADEEIVSVEPFDATKDEFLIGKSLVSKTVIREVRMNVLLIDLHRCKTGVFYLLDLFASLAEAC